MLTEKDAWPDPPKQSRRKVGPNERATRRNLRAWEVVGVAECASAVERAVTLARLLDEGAGLATAAVARELRATMDALAPQVQEDDGLSELVSGLSAPVRDSENC